MLHLCIVTIYVVIETQQTGIVRILVRLVENAQHHVQAVLTVQMTVQTGDLHDDAVVGEAVYKSIGQSFRHDVVVVVEMLLVDVKHRHLNVANLMAQQVYSYHRQGMARILHILRIRVVNAQILTETKGLRLKPGLLKFNQNEFLLAVLITDGGTKVDSKHGKRVAVLVTILVGSDLH